MDVKLVGPAAVGLSWAAGVFLLRKWPGNPRMSLSLHATSTRPAYWVFATSLSLSGLLMAGYIFGWLIPTLKLPPAFLYSTAITLILQFVTAWVPDVPRHLRIIHRFAAYGMAVMFLPVVGFFAGSPGVTAAGRIFCGACLIYMTTVLLLILFVRRTRSYYLFLQASYIATAQLAFLAAGFL